jgi:hypothetical protein
VIAVVVILALGALVAALQWQSLGREDRPLVLASFGAHLGAAFIQDWLQEVYYRGVADASVYLAIGEQLARSLEFDFQRYSVELIKLILQRPNIFPVEFGGDNGSPTTTMNGLAAVMCFAFGKSLLAACLSSALLAWATKILLYKVAREFVDRADRKAVTIAVFLMPSAVFWSSGFYKESFALSGLCVAAYGLYRTLTLGRWYYAPVAVAGVIGVAILKPYILFPFALASAAWIYVARLSEGARARFRPAYLILALGLAIGGIVVVSSFFPEFAPNRLAESTAAQQAAWQTTEGGSNLEFGSGEARTPIEQLPFVPLAFANSMFRPLPFDVRNPPMLGAALETTGLAVLLLSTLRRFRFARIRDALLASPLLAFSAVFVLTFAVAVGLATSNLGSLSRYRMPMIPMYAALLLVTRAHLARAARLDVSLARRPTRRSTATIPSR